MSTTSPRLKQNPNPTLVTSRPTSTTPTTLTTPAGPTPTSATTAQRQAELPPPSTFDFLPPLHALLARLIPTASPDTSNGQVQAATGELTGPPLEPQHLATEATSLKIRIQKARAAIEALPDVERTVEEQEVEIQEVENKVESLRRSLGALKCT